MAHIKLCQLIAFVASMQGVLEAFHNMTFYIKWVEKHNFDSVHEFIGKNYNLELDCTQDNSEKKKKKISIFGIQNATFNDS